MTERAEHTLEASARVPNLPMKGGGGIEVKKPCGPRCDNLDTETAAAIKRGSECRVGEL